MARVDHIRAKLGTLKWEVEVCLEELDEDKIDTMYITDYLNNIMRHTKEIKDEVYKLEEEQEDEV